MLDRAPDSQLESVVEQEWELVEVEDSVLDFDPWRNMGRRLRQQYKNTITLTGSF